MDSFIEAWIGAGSSVANYSKFSQYLSMGCVATLCQTTVTSGRSKWSGTSARTRCLYCAQCSHIDTDWRGSLIPVRTALQKEWIDTVILNCMRALRDQSNEECFELNFCVLLYWKLDILNNFASTFYSANPRTIKRPRVRIERNLSTKFKTVHTFIIFSDRA